MKIQRLDLSKPLMAQLEVTSMCNHRCTHCYLLDSDPRKRHNEIVTDETVLSVTQKIIDSGIFNVVVTGGEPLLKKQLTKIVLSKLASSGIRTSLNTNLTLFDADFISFLVDHHIGVLTSCPSTTPTVFNQMVGVSNYEVFENKLKEVFKAGIRCSVNMVVTKDNFSNVRETAKKLKELGCHYFSATPMFLNMENPRLELLLDREEINRVVNDLLWIEDTLNMHVDILESLPKCVFPKRVLNENHIFLNRKCQAGRTVIGISPNGDVRPCSTNTISYGNLLEEDIREIWMKMKQWRTLEYFPEECNGCKWINRCNAGCRINSFAKFGKWNSKEIWSNTIIDELPPQEYFFHSILPDSRLRVNHDYKYRQEYDGIYVVYILVDESFVMVNESLLQFIIFLEKYSITSPMEIATSLGIAVGEKSFLDTLNLLINKKLLFIDSNEKN